MQLQIIWQLTYYSLSQADILLPTSFEGRCQVSWRSALGT